MTLSPQELRTFFVTAVTAQRRRLFQVHENATLWLEVMASQREKGRMEIHAFAVMPEHVHLLFTPAPEVSLEKAMQYLKGGFSFRLKSQRDVWERGYNEERVVDRLAFQKMRRYIEQNPVGAGLSLTPEAYEFSSAGRGDSIDPQPAWFT